MNQMVQHVYFMLVTLSFFQFATPCTAGSAHNPTKTARTADETVYRLDPNKDQIVHLERDLKSLPKSAIFMRAPNLGGEISPPPMAAHKTAARPAKLRAAPVRESKLAFRPAKISGKIRQPRVAFARVALPVELRDEVPSLDFVSKTLTESP